MNLLLPLKESVSVESEATTLVSQALNQSFHEAAILVERVYSQVHAPEVQGKRLATQIVEAVKVRDEVDTIEAYTISLGFPLPRYSFNCTAGFYAPSGAILAGEYQDSIFSGFVKPDIYGHPGTVHILPLKSGETSWLWGGRPHNNEWGSYHYGSIMLAHNERVKKELARRQRARGIELIHISTSLTGADEKNGIKSGDVTILVDDSELTNVAHPGHGPYGWLEGILGEKFQPKAGRTSNQELVRIFAAMARERGINVHAGIGVGTAGASEYQSLFEVGLTRAGFDNAKAMELTQQVLGGNFLPIGLIYDMGITAEEAVWRQVLPGEPYFFGLNLVLATDKVGGAQSLTIKHGIVVKQAIDDAWFYRDMIVDMMENLANFPQQPFLPATHDYSLLNLLPHTDFD